jgi:chromate transporter
LGCINFGGPAGQIALMHRDLVEERRWIPEDRFLHALNFCMLLPGPEAQQLAIYIGWLLHGVAGGLAAGVLFVLPSVFVLLGLSWIYAAHGSLPVVVAALAGLKPVVVAIVLEAVLRIGRRALRGPAHLAIAAAAFLAVRFLGAPFPLLVLGAAVIGLLLGSRRDAATEPGGPTRAAASPGKEGVGGVGSGLVGRSEPATASAVEVESARGSTGEGMKAPRALRVIAWGLALWALPLALLAATLGLGGLHADVYLFFTWAAFITFGGAYAVLAYVTQVAVESFGWLTAHQAIDGLALAETTPGPLIMVLQFVGFMAGWNHPVAGLPPAASAAAAALLTTWATFLPSFAFIFLGAPHVERLRASRRWAAALGGITAAVVGVILNLAVVFGAAVFVPAGEVDLFAVAVAALALLVLARWRVDVLWVVAAGAALGLLRLLVGG